MALSLRKMEVLVSVAETGSVTRAAERLRLTQSAVSMSVADLERSSGGQLFRRAGKRLVANERCRLLIPEARALIRQFEKMEAMLETPEGLVGELHVGASTTIANYVLPEIIAAFEREHTRVRTVLHVGNTRQMLDELTRGTVDMALVEGPVHHGGLQVVEWRRDELVVIVQPGHGWASVERVDDVMLADAPWIMRENGSGTRDVFESAMRALGLNASTSMELGHTEAIKKAVEAGLGVACLSRVAVQRELDHGWLVEAHTGLELGRIFSLVTEHSAGASPVIETFWQHLMHDSDPNSHQASSEHDSKHP
jgi:DNA-binding transcriptional LysR family regulator